MTETSSNQARPAEVAAGSWRVRAAGAMFGALVPAAAAPALWWIGLEGPAQLAVVGTIPGLIAGWTTAPRAVSAPSIWVPALVAAVIGTLLGIVGMLIAAAVAQPFALVLWPLFLVYGAVLGFPIALPSAFVAFALLRATVGRGRREVASVVALLAVLAVLALPAIAYADTIDARRRLSDLAAKPPAAALFPVELNWEIANCSPWVYTVRVTETHLDGSEQIHDLVAPPDAVVRGRLELQPGWKSAIEADATADIPAAWRGPHETLRDALGEDMEARFEIAANGERSLHVKPASRQGTSGVFLCLLNAPVT